jgi:CAI-1 autoinducer synthase
MITANSHGNAEPIYLPDFIDKKLRQCEDELFRPRKNKKPLVTGNRLPNENSIILQSNDYLNISNHPHIRKAQIEALCTMSREPLMSAVFLHEGSAKEAFEKRIAHFSGFESSILCQSGWAANIGLMQVITDRTIPVYIDYFAHMSLWDGIRFSGATPYAFRHNDATHLDRLINEHGPGIVVADSLYSTFGDIAPLQDIIAVTNRHGCVSVIDESHSLGTHGRKGAGLVNEYGLNGQVHFITASLSKAFAGRAGVFLCPSRFAHYYSYMSYPTIFSTAILDHEIAQLNATLDVIIEEDERRKNLHEKSRYLREGLTSLGYCISSKSQIVSLESGLDLNNSRAKNRIDF